MAAQSFAALQDLTEKCIPLRSSRFHGRFLTHFKSDYEKMNAVYAEYFAPGKRPARTCVGVTALARGARVEIDFIARRPARRKARTPLKSGRTRP